MKIRISNLKNFLAIICAAAFISGLYGCSTYTQVRTPDETGIPRLLYTLPPGEFGKIWMQRTIQLTLKGPGNSPLPLIGGDSDEQRMGNRIVPMDINVTYMDSAVIAAGISEFANLAEMAENDKADFEKRYKNLFVPAGYYVFWMELTSTYSEEALDTKNWTFYLEDDKGNTYEPDKIIKVEANPFSESARQPGNSPAGRNDRERENQRFNTRTFLIHFTRKNLDGNDILSNAKFIKMVYFEWSTRDFKREGTLDLSLIKL